MGYSAKWVLDNLGITRDALRYYEKEELMPKNENGKYRDYNDEDIERLWGIKLLIGIGFHAKEISDFMKNPDFDFDKAISEKVKKLEEEYNEKAMYLKFANTIKLTGLIPTVSKMGNSRFNDFLAYAHENFNIYADTKIPSFIKLSNKFISKESEEITDEDKQFISEIFNSSEEMIPVYAIHGYYQVISDMRDLGYDSDTVQKVVKLLLEYIYDNLVKDKPDGGIPLQFMAKHIAESFLCGDTAMYNERNYGKEGCLFIAKALAFYGGYDINDL